jgi:Gas vesicle protein K
VGALQLRRRDGGGPLSAAPGTPQRLLSAYGDLDGVAAGLEELGDVFPRRVRADPETVERGLAQLVLTLIELLRQLMERQALRRMEHGALTDEQIERLGQTFMKLAERMDELKVEFGLTDADLNLDLGPLGNLL